MIQSSRRAVIQKDFHKNGEYITVFFGRISAWKRKLKFFNEQSVIRDRNESLNVTVIYLVLICPRLYKGLLLQSDADHITILPGGILDIRNFNEEVQGTYTCIASTATDFIESEFHLTLKEKCHLGNSAKIFRLFSFRIVPPLNGGNIFYTA